MDATLQDPFVGRVLDGRYRVESRVARGGMATVYLAVDRRLDREVALKIMHGHLADDTQFVSRFVREARSAARLSHPNVVQVFDQGSDGSALYLAMEYLPGRTLREALTERGALTPREALAVLDPVLDALAAAHRAGIVHRDVKPENVILTDDGRVKVADFGLARAVTATTQTTGMLMGTVAYLSPELVSRGIADARTDVYAAGILLYEMLTGRQPFTGDVAAQVAFRHVHDAVPAPSAAVPDLPRELDDLVAAATAKDPDQRPRDAAAMLELVRSARRRLEPEHLDHRPALLPRLAPAGDTQVVEHGLPHRDTQTLPTPPARGRQLSLLASPVHDVAGRSQDGAGAGTAVRYRSRNEMERRRRRGAIALAGVITLALVLAVCGLWWTAGPGAYTSTPDVSNKTAAAARIVLTRAGLSVDSSTDFSDTVKNGNVIRTDPGAGNRVRNHGTVTLIVSSGPERAEVPDVLGESRADAEQELREAGLGVAGASGRYNDDVDAGEVVSSSPPPGAMARRDKGVTLVISRGPQPIQVPRVEGLSQSEAEQQVRNAGLKPRIQEKESNKTPLGQVISQRPDSGTVPRGSTVRLVVSKGPPLVTVPNVVGNDSSEARETLEKAGFVVEESGILRILDLVRQQSPGGGEEAPKGSVVVIKIV